MSWTNEQLAIAQTFAAETSITSARIAWDDFGGKFTPPTVDPTSSPAAVVWVRPSVRGVAGTSRPWGLGATSPRYREGLVYVQHFGPAEYGEASLAPKVDETIGIFERRSIAVGTTRVVCRDAEINRVGSSGSWHQINVTVPYYVQDDADGITGVPEGATVREFTQSSHGFAVGNAIYRKADSTWAKAQADAAGTLALGLVTRVSGDVFAVSAPGGFFVIEHGLGSTPADVYLSQGTAGALTTTAPTTGISQRLGRVISASILSLNIEQGQYL